MAAGKKKPVRWTVPDVKAAPPRALEAEVPARLGKASRGYPTASELFAAGPEVREWLDEALRRIVAPVAVASAISLGASGCADIAAVLMEGAPGPVFEGAPTAQKVGEPVTMVPLGGPSGPRVAPSPAAVTTQHPSKPPITTGAGCALPTAVGALGGAPPAVYVPPPVSPAAMRGAIRGPRPHVAPPPPPPAVDPPALDGDVAAVRPDPPPMPGGLRVVHPADDADGGL